MSTVKQLADAEADRVEAAEAAEAAAAADEPAADPAGAEPEATPAEPAAGPTEADMAKLEKEHGRHEKAVAAIMGDAFDLFEPCHRCGGVGFSPREVVEPIDDPATERCPHCAGIGELVTGSRNPQHITHQCTHCIGSGYVTKAAVIPETAAPPGVTPPPAATPATPDGFVAPPGYILVPTGQTPVGAP